MARHVLVDTDVLIDVGRDDDMAIAFLAEEEKSATLATSTISCLELIVGCRNKKELVVLNKFLKRFEIIHLDEFISQKAIDLLQTYRLSHNLLIPDCLIAATAILRGTALLSKNQKDYQFIKELDLLPYP